MSRNVRFFAVSLAVLPLIVVIYVALTIGFVNRHVRFDWGMMPSSYYQTRANDSDSITIDEQIVHIVEEWRKHTLWQSDNLSFIARERYSDGKIAYIIFGHLDHLDFFDPSTVRLSPQINMRKYVSVNTGFWPGKISTRIVMPHAPFVTANVKPRGDYLIVNGIDTTFSRATRTKTCTEYSYTGYFDQIGFNVNNRSFLKRNNAMIYLFNGDLEKQYGCLSFICQGGMAKAYMIYFVKDGGQTGYMAHYPEFRKAMIYKCAWD